MFIGQYNHTIDTKGRLIIPAKLREELGEVFVVTQGLDGNCLSIYPMDEWKILANKLRSLPLNNADARWMTRRLMSMAVSCELDKQGRILLPAHLREFAQLEKDVVLVGDMDRVEIWNKENWQNNMTQDIGDVMNRLGDTGILF